MRILVTLFFISVVQFCFGQKDPVSVNIVFGEELKAPVKSTLNEIVGYDNTGVYALVSEKKSFTRYGALITLQHYSPDLKMNKELNIDLREGNKTVYLDRIVQMKDKLYLFSRYNERKTKENRLFVQSINKKSLSLNDDRQVVADIDYKSLNNDGNFSQRPSLDSSKLLVIYDLPYKLRRPERFGLKVYNENLQLLWKKDIQLPYSDELFEVKSYKVDNRGNVFIMGKVFKDKLRERKGGLPNYRYHIIAYFNKGTEVKEYTLAFQEKFITDAQFEISDEGDIICSGFYSERGTESIKGTYFLRIDGESKKLKKINYKEFEPRVLAEFISERRAAKRRELYEFDLKDLILRNDGGVMMVAEQFEVRYRSTQDRLTGNISRTYTYDYGHLIVVNINPNGTIKWVRKIPKRQTTANDGGLYSSFAMAHRNDEMYIVFNDNPRNLTSNNRLVQNFDKGRKSVVVVVKIDAEGNMIKEPLFNVRESDILTIPKVSKQVSDDEIIIYGQRQRTRRLVKLELRQ